MGCLVDVIQKNVDGWWLIRYRRAQTSSGQFRTCSIPVYTCLNLFYVSTSQNGAHHFFFSIPQSRRQGEKGWAPAMFLEEVRESSGVRRQTSIRRMNRGGLRDSISRLAGECANYMLKSPDLRSWSFELSALDHQLERPGR